jgi:hypothetical protein
VGISAVGNLYERYGNGRAKQLKNDGNRCGCRHSKRIEKIEQYYIRDHDSKKNDDDLGKVKMLGMKDPLPGRFHHPARKSSTHITPGAATIMIHLKCPAFAPTAELRKFTASLLIPTTRSEMAKTKGITIKTR